MKARAQLAVGPIGLHVGCPPRPRTRPRCMSGLLLQFLSTPRPFTNWPLARSSSSLHDFCFFMHVPGLTSPALCPETSHEPRLLSAPAFLVTARLQLASPNFTSGHILWQIRRRTLATSLLTYANFLAFFLPSPFLPCFSSSPSSQGFSLCLFHRLLPSYYHLGEKKP